MRARIVEARWHWKSYAEPVLSIDHHARESRVLTCGADCSIKIWEYSFGDDGFPVFNFVSCLARDQQRVVNIARFSPTGQLVISGHDGGAVVLWRKVDRPSSMTDIGHPDQTFNVEHWAPLRVMRGHTEDVFGIAFSPNMKFAISGSIDNTLIVWDLQAGKILQKMEDHCHYVQGVACDPLGVYIASQSSDRSVHVYVNAARKKRETTAKQPQATRSKPFQHVASIVRNEETQSARFFRDETVSTFFRRLNWSPDGLFLVATTGQVSAEGFEAPLNCAHVFLRGHWDQPFLTLPIPDEDGDQPVLAARWSPAFYAPVKSEEPSAWRLNDYRMVLALCTASHIVLYDTHSASAFAVVADLHVVTITDLTWSPDGKTLLVASRDGFVSTVLIPDIGASPYDLRGADLPKPLATVAEIYAEARNSATEESSAVLATVQQQRVEVLVPQKRRVATAEAPTNPAEAGPMLLDEEDDQPDRRSMQAPSAAE
eukprot:TRINITY_DN5733_c0_g1_i2.p1 TRINITY_DN5733_c0_g1~~TRINITY_DN5733_c0_g1_i2.p1  ORF type:complete len:485 (+),score=54.98 TRINITY_DN5733_c0_g1_i2:22-1476(+)